MLDSVMVVRIMRAASSRTGNYLGATAITFTMVAQSAYIVPTKEGPVQLIQAGTAMIISS
jgi:hypothetical protein